MKEAATPGADATRTGPADGRSGQAGAVPAAELHSPARPRPARRRGHRAGRFLPARGSESPADANRPRHWRAYANAAGLTCPPAKAKGHEAFMVICWYYHGDDHRETRQETCSTSGPLGAEPEDVEIRRDPGPDRPGGTD